MTNGEKVVELKANPEKDKIFKPNKLNKTVTAMFDNAGIPTINNDINWSDVDDIYQSLATGIIDISISFNNSIQNLNESGLYEKDTDLIAVINTFKNDLTETTNALAGLKHKRSNYSGVIKDENELALNLEIFNDLLALYDKFRAIIQPHMLEITERLFTLTQSKEEIKNVN